MTASPGARKTGTTYFENESSSRLAHRLIKAGAIRHVGSSAWALYCGILTVITYETGRGYASRSTLMAWAGIGSNSTYASALRRLQSYHLVKVTVHRKGHMFQVMPTAEVLRRNGWVPLSSNTQFAPALEAHRTEATDSSPVPGQNLNRTGEAPVQEVSQAGTETEPRPGQNLDTSIPLVLSPSPRSGGGDQQEDGRPPAEPVPGMPHAPLPEVVVANGLEEVWFRLRRHAGIEHPDDEAVYTAEIDRALGRGIPAAQLRAQLEIILAEKRRNLLAYLRKVLEGTTPATPVMPGAVNGTQVTCPPDQACITATYRGEIIHDVVDFTEALPGGDHLVQFVSGRNVRLSEISSWSVAS